MEHARSGESGTRHAHLQSPAGPPRPAARKRSTLLSWFAGLNLDIRHGGKRAFCAPADDYIRMSPGRLVPLAGGVLRRTRPRVACISQPIVGFRPQKAYG